MHLIETRRLILLPLTIEDAPAIQQTFPQWDIVCWMDGAIPWPYPVDGAATYLKDVALPSMKAAKAWHWSIRPRHRKDLLIGVASLMDQPDDNRGFWLDPSWQGRGLMTEASNAITDFWFEMLGKETLRVPKAVNNIPSRRISEKQGMRVVSRFSKPLVSGVHEMELWEIRRDEWRINRQADYQEPT